MRRRIVGLALVALLALPVAGCGGDSTGPSKQSGVAGTWNGTFSVANGINLTLDLKLAEASGKVSGSGKFGVVDTTFTLNVTGTYDAPDATLTLASEGFVPMVLVGKVSATTMSGALNGSGFSNVAVTLTKEAATK